MFGIGLATESTQTSVWMAQHTTESSLVKTSAFV